jgi:hypothetical protein
MRYKSHNGLPQTGDRAETFRLPEARPRADDYLVVDQLIAYFSQSIQGRPDEQNLSPKAVPYQQHPEFAFGAIARDTTKPIHPVFP